MLVYKLPFLEALCALLLQQDLWYHASLTDRPYRYRSHHSTLVD